MDKMSLSWPFAVPVKEDTYRSIGGVVSVGGPTFFIACSFIIIAYILHPFVVHALRRVRAHRAWRAIEKGQDVDVTQYSFVSEIFGARGVWSCDAARMAMFILSLFTFFSGLLELSLGICYYGSDFPSDKKWVDLLDRPPPVYHDSSRWLVSFKPSIDYAEVATGYLGNFGEYQRDPPEENVDIYDQGKATSVYYIYPNESTTCVRSSSACGQELDREQVRGNIVIARWSNNVTDGLYYDESPVEDWSCESSPGDGWPKTVLFANDTASVSGASMTCEGSSGVTHSFSEWGEVLLCDQGPQIDNNITSVNETESRGVPPPVILLFPHSSTDGGSSDVYMVAEETSDLFPFFYSVWKGNESNTDELQLEFYVESRSRLVEAIVTAIVLYHGEGDESSSTSGGGAGGGRCLDLVAEFSKSFEDHAVYEDYEISSCLAGVENSSAFRRARPFGENPTSSHKVVQNLFEVEPIEYGVAVDIISVFCGPCLMLLLIISVLWSLLVCSRIGTDVYDRDELIKTVCLSELTREEINALRIKMYVRRKTGSDKLEVECKPVETTGKAAGWTAWMHELLCLTPHVQAQSERSNTPRGGPGPTIEGEDSRWRQTRQSLPPKSFRFARARHIPLPRDVRHVIGGGALESLSPSPASSPAGASTSGFSPATKKGSRRFAENDDRLAAFLLEGQDFEQTEHEEQPRPEWSQTPASQLPPRAPKHRHARNRGTV